MRNDVMYRCTMKIHLTALAAACLLAACGGGDGDGANTPATQPKLEYLTGTLDWRDTLCRNDDDALSAARYHLIERIYVLQGQVFLLDTYAPQSESHCDRPDSASFIRPIRDGQARRWLWGGQLSVFPYHSYDRPGGLFFDAQGIPHVLSHSLTTQDARYVVREADYQISYIARRGPGVTRHRLHDGTYESGRLFDGRVAGIPLDWRPAAHEQGFSQVMAVRDGQGNAARFYAPHSLETGGDGLHYFIDKGLLRSLDAQLNVRTLQGSLVDPIQAAASAIDLAVDERGQVHVLAWQDGLLLWLNLMDGTAHRFALPAGYADPRLALAVHRGELLLAVRERSDGPAHWSSLYRVAPGAAPQLLLGGEKLPQTPEDFMQHPSQYKLPNLRHLEVSADGVLYLSLTKAVVKLQL